MKKILKYTLPLLVSLVLVTVAFAGEPLAPDQITNAGTLFGVNLESIKNFVVVIAGIIFVVLMLVGGIMYLTSAGNEDASKKAKTLLVDAVIGLVIVAIAWSAGGWVVDQLTGGSGNLR